jgi:hypothetical protein
LGETLAPFRGTTFQFGCLRRSGYPLALATVDIAASLAMRIVDCTEPEVLARFSLRPDDLAITMERTKGHGFMTMPTLRSGRVYRTEDFTRFDTNPTRLASKLVKSGKLRQLRKGLYYAPLQSAFGEVPPSESELLRAFFRGESYLRSGPSVWNTLGLSSTGVEVVPLVYNTTRTGEVHLGPRRFELRRVRFPRKPDAEYFVIELLENVERAGVDVDSVRRALTGALERGRFDPALLLARAGEYGTRATQELVRQAVPDGELAGA